MNMIKNIDSYAAGINFIIAVIFFYIFNIAYI